MGEGKFKIILTPTDRAGNQGEPAEAKVARAQLDEDTRPSSPPLFFASDGDELAPTSALKAKLTREATVSWIIRDQAGTVVRRGIDGGRRTPGDVRFVWDGTDDERRATCPRAATRARIRVSRPQGTYAHDVTVRMMPFQLWTTSVDAEARRDRDARLHLGRAARRASPW